MMERGEMVIVFKRGRHDIDPVLWANAGGRLNPMKIESALGVQPQLEAYKPRRGKLRKPATITVRGAQGRLAAEVRAAYGERCAIADSDISEALEAAHIDPYEDASQHHPQNGILLRRDLHSLFDRSLIAINPDSGKVEIHPRLKRHQPYSALNRRRKLRATGRGYESYAPSREAIERRWKQFLREVVDFE